MVVAFNNCCKACYTMIFLCLQFFLHLLTEIPLIKSHHFVLEVCNWSLFPVVLHLTTVRFFTFFVLLFVTRSHGAQVTWLLLWSQGLPPLFSPSWVLVLQTCLTCLVLFGTKNQRRALLMLSKQSTTELQEPSLINEWLAYRHSHYDFLFLAPQTIIAHLACYKPHMAITISPKT